MLDLLKLKTFRAVAATNSFTRAAAELGCSQSSVTTHIQNLERELGAPLFDRDSRHVVLTEVGRLTLDYADRLLALADEAKAAVQKQGELTGALSVGASEALIAYRLPDALHQFQAIYPHVQLSISSFPDSQTQIVAVLNGTIDLAVIVDERVHSGELAVQCFSREEISILKAPDYDFYYGDDFKWTDIADARVLLPDKNCAFRLLFERVLSAAQVSLANMMELGSIEAAKQCAMAGMGLAVLPKMAVTAELKHKRLIALPWPEPGLSLYLQMVRRKGRRTGQALDALWSLMEQSFASGS